PAATDYFGCAHVAPFVRGTAIGAIAANYDGGFDRTDDILQAGAPVYTPLVRDAANPLTGVWFTEEGGDAFGTGFGLATDNLGLWGAVPNPAAPGRRWVRRSDGTTGLMRVRCRDG